MTSATTDRRRGLTGDKGYKAPVTVATTANITLSGEQTIDGVAVLESNAAGFPDRVLVKNQTDTTQNGIYDVSTGTWTRSLDCNKVGDLVTGTQVLIARGTQAFQIWGVSTTTNPITPGTTALAFTQSLSAGFLATLAAPGGGSLVGFDDPRAPAYLKTVSDMLNMEEVSVLRFIDRAQHAAIRNGTTTYDMGARGRAAILELQNVRGGVLKFPSGIYLCGSAAGPDGVDNGLLVPYMGDITGPAKHIIIRGEGRNTLIKANNNNMYIVRFCDSQGGVEDLCLDWGGKTTVRALGVVPEDTTQTSTVVAQDFNLFKNLLISGCTEGIELKTGPRVTGTDSGCFYNTFEAIQVYSCLRGIWLRDCVNSGAGNNRNTFAFMRIGGPTANTGVHIDDGDTNEFHAVHFEDIQAAASPHATPTAIYIKQTGGSGHDNNYNKFFGGTIESCTRSLENINQNSEFYGVEGIYTNALLTATPRYMIGGDPSVCPQITPGGRYQTGSQLAGVPNTTMYATDYLQSGKTASVTGIAFRGKAVVNNNASATYNVAADISHVQFTGTNVGTLTINFPAIASVKDSTYIQIYTQAAVGVAVTFASTGATFVGAPATLTAGSKTAFIADQATNQWIPA